MFFGAFGRAAISIFNIFALEKITTQNLLFAIRELAMKTRFMSDQIMSGSVMGSFGQLLVERYRWKASNSKAHLVSVDVKFKRTSLELLTAFISLSLSGSWSSGFCHDAFLK